MSGSTPQQIGVRGAMEHEGTVKVGKYRAITSGDSIGGRVPKEHARVLKLTDIRETEVYVNYELGVVMHRIPDPDENE